MTRAFPLLLALCLLGGAAEAACFADYKAKRDDPLRLHYGVIELPEAACSQSAAASVIRTRLRDGWQLLDVVSVFGPEGLDQRRESAGSYYLRY
jgi:hypothetical protein